MTDTDQPALGAGNVTITLGEEEFTLKPTLAVIEQLDALGGQYGIAGLQESIMLMRFSVVVEIIRIGIGFTPAGMKSQDIKQKIYEAGISTLRIPMVDFIDRIVHGGRPAPAEPQDPSQASA